MSILLITVTAAVCTSAAPQDAQSTMNARFAEPVRVRADGRVLNRGGNVRFPSAILGDVDGDGRNELLICDEWGFVRIHPDRSESDEPDFGPALEPAGGRPAIQIPNWGSIGTLPQLVDFDGDGRVDLLAGSHDGRVYLLRGAADGFGAAVPFTDQLGRSVQLTLALDTKSLTWKDANGLSLGDDQIEEHGICAAAVDWDADGDLDLLIGSDQGVLYIQRNKGRAGAHEFDGTNDPIMTNTSRGMRPLRIPGGAAAVRVVDWNGDGLFDLVCGAVEGPVQLYLNAGEKREPYFGTPTPLVQGFNTNRDRPGADPNAPERHVHPEVVDWDGDGDLDLVVAGVSQVTPLPRELTPEEEVVADALHEEVRTLDRAIRDIYRAAAAVDATSLTAEQEKQVAELRTALAEKKKQLDVYRPSPRDEGYVWLYRRL